MNRRYHDKMIGNEAQESFHFSGAGSHLPPVVIKARSREEAERIWREMERKAYPTIEPVAQSESSEI